MATVPQIIASLDASATRADTASEQMYDVANGPATGPGSTVSTDSGPVPTLLKWFADNQAQIDALVNLAATLSAPTGSGGVGYQASGTGAVARTVLAKLRERVSVTDFGAAGNGSADDTAAIQNAINSGARTVWFPRGQYRTTAPIRVPSGIQLLGDSMRLGFVGDTFDTAAPCIKKTTNTTVNITPFEGGAAVARDCVFYIDPAYNGSFYPQKVTIDGISIVGAGASLVDSAVYFEQGSGLNWSNGDIAGVKHALRARNIWLCMFTDLQAFARFSVEVTGTSCVFTKCISGHSTYGFDGFHIEGLSYSAMIGCASDSAHESAYSIKNTWGFTMSGCGCEGPTNANANSGTALNFGGGNKGLVVTGFFGLLVNSAHPAISTADGDSITMIGGKFDTGNPVSATDLYADTFSTVLFKNTIFVNATQDTPSITFPGANASEIGVEYGGGRMKRISATQTLTDLFTVGATSLPWTPVLTFGFASVGVTYGTRVASYTVRGRVMVASFTLPWTSKGSSTGSAVITGLPLTAAANCLGVAVVMNQSGIAKRCHGMINPGDGAIFLLTEDATPVNITNADFSASGSMTVVVTVQI